VYGTNFQVVSDHRPLLGLLRSTNLSSRQARLVHKLAEYGFTLHHRAGASHQNADTLSRSPGVVGAVHSIQSDLAKEVLEAQPKDPDLTQLCSFLSSGGSELPDKPIFRFFLRQQHLFTATAQGLFYKNAVVVPASLIQKVLATYHSSPAAGHFDADRTRRRLADKYFWYGLPTDVSTYVQQCLPCRQSKESGACSSTLGCLPKPGPFEFLCLDLVGPLPACQGHRFILTMEDTFTRWVEAVPLTTITAEAVAGAFLRTWVYRFGPPVVVHSDRGTQFVSEMFNALVRLLGSRRTTTTPYHPEGNGVLERFHRSLMDRLRTAENPGNWVANLPSALFAYRCSYHKAIDTTPFNLTYGFTPSLPTDWPRSFASLAPASWVASLRTAWNLLLRQEGRQGSCKQRIRPGDMVLVRKVSKGKLEKPWHPPSKVVRILGPTVLDIAGFGPTHVNRLKIVQGGRNVG
jgi:transposase InsO family protein